MASKENGGLGIGSLEAFNYALLQKWRWHYVSEQEALWVKVIKSLHGEGSICMEGIRSKGGGVWSRIMASWKKLHDCGMVPYYSLQKVLGNGEDILFWKDTWIGGIPLFLKFPTLFLLEIDKECLLKDRFLDTGWRWKWKCHVRVGVEQNQLDSLIQLLQNVGVKEARDKCKWDLSEDGNFTIKDTRRHIEDFKLPDGQVETSWNKYVPRKVNIFFWRLRLNRLPVRTKLEKKGIVMPSVICPCCNSGVEDVQHLFGYCNMAIRTWEAVFKWLDLDVPVQLQIEDLVTWVNDLQVSLIKKHVIDAIIRITCWVIWRQRNDVVFKDGTRRCTSIKESIMEFSYLWFYNRNVKCSLSWISWLQNPLDSL